MQKKNYKLILHQQALRELKCLDSKVRERVVETIESLSDNPTPTGATRLKGRSGAYRLRVGDYRILYEVHVTEIVVYVFGIAHRREVYKRLLRRT